MKARILDGFNLFFTLTKRHFLVFYKNKIRVFYTLMVPVIILLVYVLLLRDLELGQVDNILLKLGIEENPELTKSIEVLVDSWMLSGIIALSTITVSIQTNNIIINDKENGVNRDFASSPINKNLIIGSYFLFNFIVTIMICFVVLLICLLYLAIMNEFVIHFYDFLLMVVTLIFSTISATLLTVFICAFIKKETTLASIIAVFSAVAGFLIGAYMPLSMLPGWIRNFCCFLPGTYSCNLMRFAFLTTPINNITALVEELNISKDLVTQLVNNFGYNIDCFGTILTLDWQALISVAFIVTMVVANIFSGKHLTRVNEDR